MRGKGFSLLELLFVVMVVSAIYVMTISEKRIERLKNDTVSQYILPANRAVIKDPYAADRGEGVNSASLDARPH